LNVEISLQDIPKILTSPPKSYRILRHYRFKPAEPLEIVNNLQKSSKILKNPQKSSKILKILKNPQNPQKSSNPQNPQKSLGFPKY